MLKKIMKWIGLIAGCLLLLLAAFYLVAHFSTEARASKVYSVKAQQLDIPSDAASLQLGEHVAGVRGCMDCHANGGSILFDDKNPVALLHSANLTSGKGGLEYTDRDWIRALRHGVGKDGRTLWFMPTQHTSANLSNRELGALIAYLKQLPPVDKVHSPKRMKPLGRIFTFLGTIPMFPAEAIDHNAVFADEIKPEATAAYGKYLAVGCQGCHGENLKGGPAHGPGQPLIPDLTPSGRLANWSGEQFTVALRTGKTPEGRLLSDYMPWKGIGSTYSDDEIQALYLHLKTLAPSAK